MKKNLKKDPAKPLAEIIVKGIQEKKGHDIVCLNLTKINSTICDYFIICHGDSHRQVEAIADSIEEQVWKASGEKPWHKEGKQNSEWILMDYVNVVAHVFLKDVRDFYNLEGLWADAAILRISENGSFTDKNKRLLKKDKASPLKKKRPASVS